MDIGPKEELPDELAGYIRSWSILNSCRPWPGALIPWTAIEQYRQSNGIERDSDFVEVLTQLDEQFLSEANKRGTSG